MSRMLRKENDKWKTYPMHECKKNQHGQEELAQKLQSKIPQQ